MTTPSDLPSLPADLVAAASRRRAAGSAFDRLDPTRTALLALNMQRAWLDADAPFDRGGRSRIVLPRINRLASVLRSRGGTVAWLQMTAAPHGSPAYWSGYFDTFVRQELRGAAVAALEAGSTRHALHPDVAQAEGDLVLPKHRFSAFLRNPHDLETLLRERGIDTVIVTGVATNVCCESTARDAMMRDFRTIVPFDAVAAPDDEAHLGALRSLMQVFADVRPAAEVEALTMGR
jgi:ureidoacrylate peracid hydrolase